MSWMPGSFCDIFHYGKLTCHTCRLLAAIIRDSKATCDCLQPWCCWPWAAGKKRFDLRAMASGFGPT